MLSYYPQESKAIQQARESTKMGPNPLGQPQHIPISTYSEGFQGALM